MLQETNAVPNYYDSYSTDDSLIDDSRLLVDDTNVTFTVGAVDSSDVYTMPTSDYADVLSSVTR
jgi:hypothetical protein